MAGIAYIYGLHRRGNIEPYTGQVRIEACLAKLFDASALIAVLEP